MGDHPIFHNDLQHRAVKHTEGLRAARPIIDHKLAVVPVEVVLVEALHEDAVHACAAPRHPRSAA